MDGELSLKMGGATNPCAASVPRSCCCRCYSTRDIPFRALGSRLFLFSLFFLCCCCWSTRRCVTKATARSTRVCVCAFRRWRRCVREICSRGRVSMVCVCVCRASCLLHSIPSFVRPAIVCIVNETAHTTPKRVVLIIFVVVASSMWWSHETSFSFEVTVQTFRRAFSFTCVAI